MLRIGENKRHPQKHHVSIEEENPHRLKHRGRGLTWRRSEKKNPCPVYQQTDSIT